MPQVPTYGPRRVSTAPMPGVRRTAAETPLSTGATLLEQQATINVRKAESIGIVGRVGAGVALQIAEEYQRRANDTAELDYENQLSSWESKALYGDGQNPGALALQGKNAQGAPEQVLNEYDKFAGKVAATLGNDEQRSRFKQASLRRRASIDMTLRRHVLGEMQQYEAGELNSFVKTQVGLAIAHANEPVRAEAELGLAIDKIMQHAPGLGAGPEQVEEQVAAVKTSVYVGVVRSLIGQDRLTQAKQYFDLKGDEIRGEIHTQLAEQLGTATETAREIRMTDFVAAGGGTLTEQIERAKGTLGVDDPILDKVIQRLRVKDRDQKEAKSAAEQAMLDTVYTDIYNRGMKALTPGVVAQLGTHVAAARNFAESISKPAAIETNLVRFYELRDLALADPKKFVAMNLFAERYRFEERDFRYLKDLQLDLKAGDAKKLNERYGGTQTVDQMFRSTLSQFGIDATPTEAAKKDDPNIEGRIAQVRRLIDLELERLPKDAKPSDAQAVIDRLVGQALEVNVPGSWWNFWPGGKSVSDTKVQKRLIDLTIADVPAADRAQIEAALRAKGRPVNDPAILDLYLRSLAGKK